MTASIIEQIKILAELQKIDYQIHEYRVELATFPDKRKALEADFEIKKGAFKSAEEELKKTQLTQKTKEIDLQQKEDKIQKLQGQLFQLKTNKEYSAMELEIKGLKADKSVLEEEILRFFDEVEAQKTRFSKAKELLAAEEKKMKQALDELQKETAALEAKVAAEEDKRKHYTPNIDPKLLAQYEKLLKNRDGLALVPVRAGSCGGCNMELPPQQVNEIQLTDKLINCESCARILYWNP